MSASTEFVKPGGYLEEQVLQQLGRIESLEQTLGTVTAALQRLSGFGFNDWDHGLIDVREAGNSFFVRLFVREDVWVAEGHGRWAVHSLLKLFHRAMPFANMSFECVSHLCRKDDAPSDLSVRCVEAIFTIDAPMSARTVAVFARGALASMILEHRGQTGVVADCRSATAIRGQMDKICLDDEACHCRFEMDHYGRFDERLVRAVPNRNFLQPEDPCLMHPCCDEEFRMVQYFY